jgi:PKD repeat protein
MIQSIRSICGAFITAALLSACGEADFPVPPASTVSQFSYSVDNAFAPATVTFVNESWGPEGSGTLTHTWSFGDGNSSTEANPTHTYTRPGSYQVRLVVVSDTDIDESVASVLVKDPTALQVALYYIDAAGSFITDLDGNAFDTPGGGFGIAYDATSSKIYFTDNTNGTLMRSDTDGGNMEEVANGFVSPRGVALDVANQKAYVTDRGAGVNAIFEVDMAGKTKTVLYNSANDGLGEKPEGIAFYDDVLYVTCVEIDAEAVWTASTDGSGVTRIIDYGAGGYGYGIAVDGMNETIYFHDDESGQILMSALDGSNVRPFTSVGGRVYGIAVDNTNEKVYWSDNGDLAIRMANLDGSTVVDLAVDLNDPLGIFFID